MKAQKKMIASAILALVAIISLFAIAPKASNPESYAKTIAYLDEKEKTVMVMAGGTTAASIALGMVPGDTTTPIADELMDMVDYLVIILCTIFLERCLLSIAGFLAFKILIPLACLVCIIFIWMRRPLFYRLAFKLAVFGMALFLVVPASVKASQLVEKTNEVTIQNAINGLNEITEEVEASDDEADAETDLETDSAVDEESGEVIAQASNDETDTDEKTTDEEADEEESSGGIFSKAKQAVSDAVETATATVSDIAETATSTVSAILAKAQTVIDIVMQSIMVMLVTSCVIPLLVLFAIWSLVRQIIGIKLEAPDLDNFRRIEDKRMM